MEEVPKDPKAIPSWISRAIKASQSPRGLAILIGLGTRADPRKMLKVNRDLFALKETFNKLKFSVLELQNPTQNQLEVLINSIMDLSSIGIEWPSSWKRIVVAYTGPGLDIESESDVKKTKIDHIIDAFISCQTQEFMVTPKLFFMDYDRGGVVDSGFEVVSRGLSIETGAGACGDQNPFKIPKQKYYGKGNRRIPSQGNYLMAYSTVSGKISCSNHNGSCWIQTLSKFLIEVDLINLDIENVLKRVNMFLIKEMDSSGMLLQQPEYISTLNEELKLLKEAKTSEFICKFQIV